MLRKVQNSNLICFINQQEFQYLKFSINMNHNIFDQVNALYSLQREYTLLRVHVSRLYMIMQNLCYNNHWIHTLSQS